MKRSISIAVLSLMSTASFAAITPVTPVTATQFNPATALSNASQQNLRSSILNVTNGLNSAAAGLGVSNQIQWTGTATGGASSNIASDLGSLFQKIDTGYTPASTTYTAATLSFDANGWAITGAAPTSTTTAATGYSVADIKSAAGTLATNLAAQSNGVISSMAGVVTGQVGQYNTSYVTAGINSSASYAAATADYNTITSSVSSTKAAVDAARNFAGLTTLSSITDLSQVSSYKTTGLTSLAGGKIQVGNKVFNTYTDYVANNGTALINYLPAATLANGTSVNLTNGAILSFTGASATAVTNAAGNIGVVWFDASFPVGEQWTLVSNANGGSISFAQNANGSVKISGTNGAASFAGASQADVLAQAGF